MTNPGCPKCKDLGWYEGPYYGDFEPKVIKLACEDCGRIPSCEFRTSTPCS